MNKIVKGLLSLIMTLGVFLTVNSEIINEVKAETNAADAPNDWAFTEDSIPLHDAILKKYDSDFGGSGNIDSNNDGYISESEANAYTGQISLNNSSISGTLTGIEKFTNPALTEIRLGNNQLTGVIPSSIGDLTNLKILLLNNNQISGTIPTSISNLRSLTHLYLEDNQLSGIIPSDIGNISTLTVLTAQRNQLTGIIPSSLGNTNLEKLSLHENQLTGIIPPELGKLTNLKTLALANNNLTGTIPPELGNCNLMELYLSNNILEGEIPSELGNLTGLKYFELQSNNLMGIVPESIYQLSNIIYLDLSNNSNLEGNPTEGFDDNNTLQYLNVSGTNMIQAKPGATNLADDKFVYDNLAEMLLNSDGTDIVDGITQSDIDRAQESAVKWSEPTRSEWQEKIDKAQSLLNEQNAEQAVNDLFDEDGKIKEEITQVDIDKAKDLVDNLSDGDKKTALQDKLEEAQRQLNERNAEKAVDDLFDKDGNIRDTVIEDDIENAEDLVNKLPDGQLKEELNDKLKEAQKQLDERNFLIIEAFKVFTGEGTVYTKIDAPAGQFSKVYVDGKLLPASNYVVTSGSTVITLNEAYLKILDNGTYDVEIEFASGAVVKTTLTVDVEVVSNPSTPANPTPQIPGGSTPSNPTTIAKPTTSTGSSTSTTSVNTGDTNNVTILYGMLAAALLGIVIVSKKRKQDN